MSLWRWALRSYICSSHTSEKDYFLLPLCQDAVLSATSPAPCLSASTMSYHDDNGLLNYKPAPIKCFSFI